MFEYRSLKIYWLGHDTFKIKNAKTIYFDPYQVKGGETADLIFITHEHFDHLSVEDVRKISSSTTVIITIPLCKPQLSVVKAKEIKTVKPGDKLTVENIEIHAIPAYNTNKFREPGLVFHPKDDGRVGFVVSLGGIRIYHAGDTDWIPEVKDLEVDIALIPVSGTYVMTANEAADAMKTLRAKIAIPMHYGSIVGNEQDAEEFKRLATCEVRILKRE